MPSLKVIRTRIASVKSTQKITKAMKMVAGARLNRAQQRIVAMRPYAVKTGEILQSVAAQSNVNKAAEREWKARQEGSDGASVQFLTLGRKGREYLTRRAGKIAYDVPKVYDGLDLGK